MKLNYNFEIEIKKPVDQVTRLFTDRNYMSKWQKGLLINERLPDLDGQERYMLMYGLGRRKMKITETIIRNELPIHYDVNFKIKGAQHTMHNSFYESGKGHTKWVSNVEYHFTGLMHFIAGFNKNGFEQQSLNYMRSFKAFSEMYGSG